MREYVHRHIIQDAAPEGVQTLWILRSVLRVTPTEEPLKRPDGSISFVPTPSYVEQVYEGFHALRPIPSTVRMDDEAKSYLDKWNSARADLIAEMIPPPSNLPSQIREVSLYPEGDVSYWLAATLLGYTDREIGTFCGIKQDELSTPYRKIMPLLKMSYRELKRVQVGDPLLHAYTRTRHLLMRYYLDAVYHEIS